MTGKCIAVEGGDGSGKGTQMKLLEKAFAERGYIFVREPSHEGVRNLLFGEWGRGADALSQMLLLFADRNELAKKIIIPELEMGNCVFSDRNFFSTWAYQVSHERDTKKKRSLERMFKIFVRETYGEFLPDLTIILRVSPAVAHQRVLKRGGGNHFDTRPIEYHEKVWRAYQEISEEKDYLSVVVDGEGEPEEVHKRILWILKMKFPGIF